MADLVESLVKIWEDGKRPDLGEFVRSAGPLPTKQLADLIRIDQLRRWETPAPPADPDATNKYAPPRGVPVETYVAQFPELQAAPNLLLDLILNEYSIRAELGQKPNVDEYAARFPKQAAEIRRQIERRSGSADNTSVSNLSAANETLGNTIVGAGSMPEKFGRYRVVKTIGEGGMGKVYLAEDSQLQRSVALKVPHFGGNDGPDVIERFYREARIAAAFHHPNLCPVYDVGMIDGTHYLTMPFLAGESMSAWLKRMGPLPQAQACRLVARIAQALHVAHQAGVLHRDLKPANIMLTEPAQGDPNPIVMDFGLARRGGSQDPQLTGVGAMIGTAAYMPPEQVVGDGSLLGPTADVYSLGGILYQMLTGRTPFVGQIHDVLRAVMAKAPPSPKQFRPDLDPALEAVCLKALAKEPADRYASMADFAAALAPFCSDAAIASVPAARPVPKDQPATKKSNTLILAGIVALPVVAAIVFWTIVLPMLSPPTPVDPQAKIDPKLAPFIEPNVPPEVKKLDPEEKLKPENKDPEEKSRPEVKVEDKTPAHAALRAKLASPKSVIRSLAFNPKDSNQLAVGTEDSVVRLWDLKANTHRELKGNPGPVRALAFSPDGKQLASAGGDEKKLAFDVILWNVEDGKNLVNFNGHFAPVTGVSFSHDSKTLASCGTDNTIRLWDAEGRKPKEIKRLDGDQSFNAVAYHPQLEILASGSDDETVRVWNLETGKFKSLKGHKRPVISVAISLDGSMVASGSSVNNLIKIWGVNDASNYATLTDHKGAVNALTFTRNEDILVSGGADGAVMLWAIGAGGLMDTYEMHKGDVFAVAVSPDGRTIASGGKDQTVLLWNMPKARQ